MTFYGKIVLGYHSQIFPKIPKAPHIMSLHSYDPFIFEKFIWNFYIRNNYVKGSNWWNNQNFGAMRQISSVYNAILILVISNSLMLLISVLTWSLLQLPLCDFCGNSSIITMAHRVSNRALGSSMSESLSYRLLS